MTLPSSVFVFAFQNFAEFSPETVNFIVPQETVLKKRYKGPSIQDVRTKLRKIDPFSLVRKMSAPVQPPLSMRIHHKFLKIRRFLRQKVRTYASEEIPLSPCPHAKCPYWTNPPPPDCGRLLWTIPNVSYIK